MVVLTYVFGSSDPWLVILYLISYLSLVLCCDIYRSTLISIMYPACMITVHDHTSRVLQRCYGGSSGEGRWGEEMRQLTTVPMEAMRRPEVDRKATNSGEATGGRGGEIVAIRSPGRAPSRFLPRGGEDDRDRAPRHPGACFDGRWPRQQRRARPRRL